MLISVFTPTYNRANLLHRVFDSLNMQGFTDFEWIVVDDGSTDDTLDLLGCFRAKAKYPIKVYRQENRGKARSINTGLDLAEGELFICFDSDDWCTPNAFARIAEVWSSLSAEERDTYCGISCLKVLEDGSVVGEDYSRMNFKGESYVHRFNKRIRGDKWEIIRTDLHRAARYDLFKNERYMAPEYAWLKIGRTHNTVFLNEALSIVEYQPEGISLNNLSHRVSSAISTSRFYLLAWGVSDSARNRLRAAINHTRFSFHGNVLSELPLSTRMITIIPGLIFFCKDLISLRKKAARRAK